MLDAAFRVFLSSGFHAATIEDLERATGLTWGEVRQRFGDKEGLFFAAIEQRLETCVSRGAAQDEVAALAALLRRVTAAGSTAMLRAQHREALRRLARLAEVAAGG